MMSFTDVLVLIGMFALRFGVPLAVVVGLGYLLKRLDRRWEREARAAQAAEQGIRPVAPQPTVATPQPARRTGKDVPGPQLPFDPAGLGQRSQPGPALTAASAAPRRCWDAKNCSAEKQAQCAASKNPDVPCWQARLKVERQMPEACFDCDVYKNYPRI